MKKFIKSETEPKQEAVEKPQREVIAQERELLRSQIARLDEDTAPKIALSQDGKDLSIDFPDEKIGLRLVFEQFGTTNRAFAIELVTSLLMAAMDGTHTNANKFNAMLNIVTSSKPRNEFDAMLAAQTAVTHFAIMKTGLQMASAKIMIQQESAQRMYAKLSQLYLGQREALKRGRAADENTFAVRQTVNVSDGGQAAIVTNVTRSEALPANTRPQLQEVSPRALSDRSATSTPIIENGQSAAAPIKRVRLRNNV